MDRIWSPWRHSYVTRSEEPPGCVFCIARTIGEGRQLIVHEGMTVVGEVRVLPEELPRTAERLRPIFAKLGNS